MGSLRECHKEGCTETFLVYPSDMQKYCSTKCKYSCPKFKARQSAHSNAHQLSEIDTDARLGTCAICGENTPVRLRKGKRDPTSITWRCRQQERIGALVKKLKITADEALAILQDEPSVCLICSKPYPKTPHIDHCHTCGEYRGLLCSGCNSGLGFFYDDVNALENAIKYLKAHQCKE